MWDTVEDKEILKYVGRRYEWYNISPPTHHTSKGKDSPVKGSALQCDISHSAQSESPVTDERLDRKGVGSSTFVPCYSISWQGMGTSLSGTRRERRLPLSGLTIDERLTPLSIRRTGDNIGLVRVRYKERWDEHTCLRRGHTEENIARSRRRV